MIPFETPFPSCSVAVVSLVVSTYAAWAVGMRDGQIPQIVSSELFRSHLIAPRSLAPVRRRGHPIVMSITFSVCFPPRLGWNADISKSSSAYLRKELFDILAF